MTATLTGTTGAADSATAALIGQVRAAEREAAAAYGPFSLFGLFEREDTPGRWDVIVSAPWLTTDRQGILTIAQHVSRHLTPEQAILIARIVPLAPGSAFVQAVNAAVSVGDGGFNHLPATVLGSAEITQGYVLVSRATPVPQRQV